MRAVRAGRAVTRRGRSRHDENCDGAFRGAQRPACTGRGLSGARRCFSRTTFFGCGESSEMLKTCGTKQWDMQCDVG
eukprot:3209670-Pyramimonas_sp.AAC.1